MGRGERRRRRSVLSDLQSDKPGSKNSIPKEPMSGNIVLNCRSCPQSICILRGRPRPRFSKLAGLELGKSYPRPIVDLKASRTRALGSFCPNERQVGQVGPDGGLFDVSGPGGPRLREVWKRGQWLADFVEMAVFPAIEPRETGSFACRITQESCIPWKVIPWT